MRLDSRAGAVLAAGAAVAWGGVCSAQTHRERSAWAVAIGGVDVHEAFTDYIGDVAFRERPVVLSGGMTVRQLGNTTLHEFRNFVDAPAFGFPDHNQTTHLSCWVDYPEPGETGIQVEITFDRPLVAWGADFWGAATAERLDVAVVGVRGVELGVMQATRTHSNEWEFLGFVAPQGEAIERIVMRSRRRFLGTGGEGFGMDNIAVKFVGLSQSCYADCDSNGGPGVLDIFDFLCFQARFDAQDPYACDCDTSGGLNVCDVFDFLCFQTRFDAGCP